MRINQPAVMFSELTKNRSKPSHTRPKRAHPKPKTQTYVTISSPTAPKFSQVIQYPSSDLQSSHTTWTNEHICSHFRISFTGACYKRTPLWYEIISSCESWITYTRGDHVHVQITYTATCRLELDIITYYTAVSCTILQYAGGSWGQSNPMMYPTARQVGDSAPGFRTFPRGRTYI